MDNLSGALTARANYCYIAAAMCTNQDEKNQLTRAEIIKLIREVTSVYAVQNDEKE